MKYKAFLITAIALCVLVAISLSGCSTEEEVSKSIDFSFISDKIEQLATEQAEKAEQQQEPIVEPIVEEEPEYEEEYYEDYYYEDYYESYPSNYSGDGFMQRGHRPGVDSNTETWYSSKVRSHGNMENWYTDDEGYWHDDNGYYVVSSDDYKQYSIVNTSKGEACVHGDGTASGNIDMYVSW